MNKVCYIQFKVRILLLISVLFVSVGTYGAKTYNFTPTDGGQVVNLKQGDRILLSTIVNGEEYFVCHYPSYTGGYFSYTNWDDDAKGNILKLIPQTPGATEPGSASIWTIDDPVTFLNGGKNYTLDGIAYTMWSTNPEGDPYTLLTYPGKVHMYRGNLTREKDNKNICNAIFVVPTDSSTVTTFDPYRKLTELEGRTDQDAEGKFNGEKGYGFLGLPYREVYWLDIPRGNGNPISYLNASVIGFNKTLNTIQYSSKEADALPGQALYAFGNKEKHHYTPRTIFRLYILDETTTSSCPDSYFFAFDEQDYKQYNKDFAVTPAKYTTKKKTYTIDRLVCMERQGDTKYYQTDWMTVPEPNSTYYYVGYQNKYCSTSRGDAFNSQYDSIQTLKLQHMDLPAPRGAYGRMIVDVTQTSKPNLGVEFRPAGVFLRVDAGGGRYRNIEMHPEPGDTSWICNEMWTITDKYATLTIKATLYSGAEFSETDEGFDVDGWSEYVVGNTVPLADDPSKTVSGNMTGWARVYTNKSTTNGGLEFVRAEKDKYVRYDNNGHFGAAVPNTHAKAGETSVVLSEARLLDGYEFLGWYTLADTTAGSFTKYKPGDVVTFSDSDGDGKDSLILYAQAKYTGGIGVAISFMKDDGKRYFLTHPNTSAPRYAKARHFADWTDTYQGMSDANNSDSRFLSTYRIIGNNTECEKCEDGEYVLDPRRETVHGAVDSLTFYEHFMPANEEYIGLYYVEGEFNKILANDTWAGLFQSTKGWPDPMSPCIDSTKLYSTHYLSGYPSTITRHERPNNAYGDTVYYNPTTGYFDGAKSPVTNFTISGVGVVDEHYVVLPDTSVEWTDTITFGIHQDEAIQKGVWSKLIGKQLMLQMMVGDKITYFHPNDDKTITEYTQMRLNGNYRLDETFEYIRDARVESLGEAVLDIDKPHMNDRLEKNYFGRLITSGMNTPVDVQYNGEYIDIIDTIRITLRPLGPNKIKEYYGRWKEGAPGLHIRPDGSRYRDIIVRTKTVHYGDEGEKLVFSPVMPVYRFSPLINAEKVLSFTLAKVRYRQLLDTEGHVLAEEILSSVDYTSALHITHSQCTFTTTGGASSIYFNKDNAKILNDQVALITQAENNSGPNYDTLLVNTEVTINAITSPVSCRVPLVQTTLESEELVWSAVVNGQRYFIMAGEDGESNKSLIFRQYDLKGGTLYKKEDGKTQLVKGSADPANSDTKYITLWRYTYVNQGMKQITLAIDDPVDLQFIITGGSTPGVQENSDPATAATLTYEYVNVYVNDNENFEEQVKLKYGNDKWLKLTVTADVPSLTLVDDDDDATVFSFTYLEHEYDLLNNGVYPNKPQLEFGYNNTTGASVQTRYKARRVYSMLLNNTITYCGLEDEADIADLVDPEKDWKTDTTFTLIRDSRFAGDSSHLSISTNAETLETTVTPSGDSPLGTMHGGKYVNIVDTLDVQISLQRDAPEYHFADAWSSFKSVEDAHLKIPLIRKTYHSSPYDSLICTVDRDEYTYVFPPEISTGVNDTHTFTFGTDHRWGTNILDVDNHVVSYSGESDDHTDSMHLGNPALAEIRLIEADGSTPDWCEITAVTDNTITVRCKGNGIRSSRSANIYLAYAMEVGKPKRWRYINFHVQVMQGSRFQYEGNQHLVHSKGASGDDLKDGVQQVHENKTILYYYNASAVEQSEDQRVELPIRERNFYGWWRWYREGRDERGNDVSDMDVPDSLWQTRPTNTAGKWNIPFRTIGDSVPVDPGDPSKGKKLVTQGRYTVFHYPSADYNARKDPPSKAPMVYPPINKRTVTYAVDLSVYYDNLPLSMKEANNVDRAKLDTMEAIIEPTLSIREVFELRPWTEMAERLEGYKSPVAATYSNERYMEDHVVRAPLNNRLLLKTEQRYSYDNIKKGEHSESLLGYYMRDDNWDTWSADPARQDSMIWCAGWDAKCCAWYTYNPKTQTYDTCTYTITEANDFLSVPKKTSMPAGQDFDTVIYCLRAKSIASTNVGTVTERNDPGAYWFNICRYTIIYHRENRFGPKLETSGKAIITNNEIEENFDVLERLNFDYNKPGTEYTVYPHPLPWADASYGFAYPKTASLPDNRPHNKNGLENLANMGEYNLINRIPSFGSYWHKMEQHGGASNGYMIFCDGMSSAGQVAALRVDTTLCEGQKMYFSAYVGNPYGSDGKTCPNFTFSVQGSENGRVWEDITTYMTGDLARSDKWYQIYFPIEMNVDYTHFRVQVYNMAANDDGNDFIIDDMCIFATKPPLMVYQANTTCKNENEADSLTHIVLRVDYQGFTDEAYAAGTEFYTIQEITKSKDTTFLKLEDGYYREDIKPAIAPSTKDTVYGQIGLPDRHYEPTVPDSIFPNLQGLIAKFETTLEAHEAHEKDPSKPVVDVFRKGYVFEHLDDSIRPVLYVVHSAKMSADNTYVVHMAGAYNQLLSSQCALTRSLKVRNRMILTLNGEEKPEKEVTGMCANALYDVSLHVKGTLLLDSVAPIEVTGSCYNDWLLYGDTTKATSASTYGYQYSDIEKVIKDILRADAQYGGEDNSNQFARALVEVDSAEMARIQDANGVSLSSGDLKPYTILKHLVNNGLLTLYQSNITITTPVDSTVHYTIFPISGSGSEVLQDMNIDVCPTPVHIALESNIGGGVPLIIGGLNRTEEESQYPIVVLADAVHANEELHIPIDSLMMQPGGGAPEAVLKQIQFISTDDPEFRDGIDNILLAPDRTWNLGSGENPGYYQNGNDTLVVVPASETNYRMRPGYNYTFGIEMMTHLGSSGWTKEEGDDCPVGTVPFTVSVVPDYLRWDPQTADNRWNNPANWIGIDQHNTLIHDEARYAPLSTTHVLIPPMTDGRPYPVLPALPVSHEDSIQMVGFQYNKCKSIRFLPGGALNQQQRLEYDSVIADLSAPNHKWALRSAPIEGLLSGDLYMANADLSGETPLWEVGSFDASGRNYNTGNATFWLSLYSREVKKLGYTVDKDSTFISAADWSKVTNAMRLPLKPAQGWAVYSRTKSGDPADVRLPKNDDMYYYFTTSGSVIYDRYESGLREERATSATSTGSADKVGKLAFYPGKAATSEDYTLTNGTESKTFVFGNPTMGYIDIWGFIADNTSLKKEFRYIKANGLWEDVTEGSLVGDKDTIVSLVRYLPPMHALELKLKDEMPAAYELEVTLNTNRIVTAASQRVAVPDPAPAPMRQLPTTNDQRPIAKGIMTITAVNPASPRCTSRLLLGQGFNEAVLSGEDAVLTTVNIDNFSMTNAPATPFNIYALEGNSGLSIDLRDEIVNVPVSFYNSELPFEPNSYLWFTGVNNIDGDLVLYDELLDIERPILDGICLEIETPETSHMMRYYIRRPGYVPGQNDENPVTTGFTPLREDDAAAVKFIRNGQVFILRDGHVYSIYGQQIR